MDLKIAHMKLDKREKIKMVQGSIMQHVITSLQFNRLTKTINKLSLWVFFKGSMSHYP